MYKSINIYHKIIYINRLMMNLKLKMFLWIHLKWVLQIFIDPIYNFVN